MKTLQEIWDDSPLKSDKGSAHSYIPVYENILAPYRETAKNVLEIGLFNGYSLLMWEKYFTNADVYGIDCDEQPHGGMADLRPLIAEGTHNIVICDATSEAEIKRHFGNIKWDIVIDDGSHALSHQLKTIEIFIKRLNKGGMIIIEDIQDISESKHSFINLYSLKTDVQIIDRRQVKGRYDDVIVYIKDK